MMSAFFKMADINTEFFLGKTEFIKVLAPKNVQEKESNMSLRKGWTNWSLGSDLSIRTSHSCQILIFWPS